MTLCVAFSFLFQVCLDGFVEIDACLVREADQYKKDIGHFVGEIVGVVGFFKALFSVSSGKNSCEFSDFFHEYCEVCHFREVSDADGADPLIDFGLKFRECFWGGLLHLVSCGVALRVSCEGLGWGFGVRLRRSISESLGGERESIVTHSLRCCIADCSLAAAVVLGGREDRSVFRCLRGLASRRGSLLPESSEKSAQHLRLDTWFLMRQRVLVF